MFDEEALISFLVVLPLSIIISAIWGFLANRIINKKGYYENWFWWGFFFGWIVVIVALLKPDLPRDVGATCATYDEKMYEKANERTLNAGGWKCNGCGKILPHYTGTCGCGNTKANNEKLEEEKRTLKEKSEEVEKTAVNVVAESGIVPVDAVVEI